MSLIPDKILFSSQSIWKEIILVIQDCFPEVRRILFQLSRRCQPQGFVLPQFPSYDEEEEKRIPETLQSQRKRIPVDRKLQVLSCMSLESYSRSSIPLRN